MGASCETNYSKKDKQVSYKKGTKNFAEIDLKHKKIIQASDIINFFDYF